VASRRVAFPIRSSAKFRRFADVVIAISRSVMDVCRQSGIPESMLRLVYSGVDPKRAASGDRYRGRRSLRLREDEPLIVVVARLTPCKGHSCFLQALPTIRSHYPKLRVALVGDGELSATLKAETHRLGLARHVMFLGHRRDVPDLIRAADLFVMPSHVEGLCTSLLDAMFARVPIVTTGVGGIADVIDLESPQGPCSWLATPNDSSDLARVIIDGLSEKEESTRLIEQAYQRAWKNFTHQRMVAGTLAIYREWLATDCRRAA
jgi:glycosyltransferase involved in cell wall biosynthesis